MTSKSGAPPSFHAGPVPFITFDRSTQQFTVEDFACQLLNQISGKVAVICLSGQSKGHLLNRLIGLPPGGAVVGFDQVTPNHPSDIWMWGQPVQLGDNFFAILLSSPSASTDPKSIAISLAVSSLFVYVNSEPNRIEPILTVSQIEQALRGTGPSDASPAPRFFAVYRDQKCSQSKLLESDISSSSSGDLVRNAFPVRDCWTVPSNDTGVEKFVEAVYVSSIDTRSTETDFVVSGAILVQLAQQYCHLLNLGAGQDSVLPSIAIPSLNEAWNMVVQLQLKSALREAIGCYRSILSEEGMKKLPLTDSKISAIHSKAKSAAKALIPRYLIVHLQRVSAISTGGGLDANATTGDVNESLTTTDVGSWELFSREFKIRRNQLLDHLKNENGKIATEKMEKVWIDLVKSRIDPIINNSVSKSRQTIGVSPKQMMDIWDNIVGEFHKECVKNFPSTSYAEFVIRSMIPSMLGLSVNCIGSGGVGGEVVVRLNELEKERAAWTNRVIQLETQLNDQKSVYEDLIAKKEVEVRGLRDMCGSPTLTLAPDNSSEMSKIREILSQLKNSDSEKKMLQVRAENEQNLIQLERKFNKQLNEARRKNELLIDNVKVNYEAEITQLKDQRAQLYDTIRSLESQVSMKQVEMEKMSAIVSANENDRILRGNFANVINQQSELILQFLKNKTVLDSNQMRELENLRAQANELKVARY